jgi:hypothetical protein
MLGKVPIRKTSLIVKYNERKPLSDGKRLPHVPRAPPPSRALD